MTTVTAQVQAVAALSNAITETVKEAGDHGAPSGVLYMALMHIGITLAMYEQLMDLLVEAGRLTRRGDLYFTAKA